MWIHVLFTVQDLSTGESFKFIQIIFLTFRIMLLRRHSDSITNANRLIFFRKIITLCFENHTKHINALCPRNSRFCSVRAGGMYDNHCALKGQLLPSFAFDKWQNCYHISPPQSIRNMCFLTLYVQNTDILIAFRKEG
jgi:hypothetical protein